MNDKNLLEEQIEKIFSIIELNDNSEISKIAFETLANKYFETPECLYMIFKHLINISKKGNLRLIENSKFLIDAIFEDFDSKTIVKIFKHSLFKEQITKLMDEDVTLFTIDQNSNLEILNEITYLQFSIINTKELKTLENLYSSSSESEIVESEEKTIDEFEKVNLKILLPDKDDSIRTEIENSKNPKYLKSNKNSNNKKIIRQSISLFYENSSIKEDISHFLDNIHKKRKVQNNENMIETQKIVEVYFNPLYNIFNQILALNHNCNWKTRLCSITLLNYLKLYMLNSYFTLFKMNITYKVNESKYQFLFI